MSNITKQQWKEIEQALSEMHVNVRFEYKGFELTVQRIRIKESKLALRVYINDEFKGSWFTDAIDGKENEVSSIFKDVFKLCQKSIYTAAEIKKVEKALGKTTKQTALS
ncbi:hypothetical protein AT251_07755 [Enterovibrio nigricans]|nr:hypothetical protein [Enterovibrio nigricans]PKF50907.1 hypothetical protein AT251_07755 [Enterovibrio nigricans]